MSTHRDTRRLGRYVFWAMLAIALVLLWTEHRVHLVEYLPLGLLFACLGMHLLMHGAHGRGHGRADKSEKHTNADADAREPSRPSTAERDGARDESH